MCPRFAVAPEAVHQTLARHLQTKGLPLVLDLDKSHGSWAHDARSGKEYLDLTSFYAANALGFNHAGLSDAETEDRLLRASSCKVGNPDFYTTYLAEFVETLANTAAPAELPHYFFVEGGALGVENAMKAAFDWKVRKNLAAGRHESGSQILHFTNAFHGRSGYTLSVTNTDPVKTAHFPKFDWPRVHAPSISFPLDAHNRAAVERAEAQSLNDIERAFAERGHDIAAILIEPIQSEGGDNHFRSEFLRKLRSIADEREALLIFDEVQSGMGMTGRWWCCQHFDVLPDILTFAKKMQVGGMLVSRRIDEVEGNVFRIPGRISSTWGGALVDMVRATRILELIESEHLLENAAKLGDVLLDDLQRLSARFPKVLSNARGLGLLCAVDVPNADLRSKILEQAFAQQLLLLPCGSHSIRFRPHLTVSAEVIAEGLKRFGSAVEKALA
ncbi:MAG TPA: L-lysine 6-transaminase [Polyangiaceae bacterium]|nr:L-lysine 6-transaminase [Polyangiaceae bacterium]